MIDVLNAVAFFGFLIPLLLGAGVTLARVVSYRLSGDTMPRLLVRDAQVIGGFAVTCGLLFSVRVLRAAGVDVSGLATSPWWIVVTAGPAIWAVVVWAWYEIFVIERGGTAAYRERERDSS